MCVTLPYKDGLRKYSLIFQRRPNSTHKIYIKSMLTVIGERREFFNLKNKIYIISSHAIILWNRFSHLFVFCCYTKGINTKNTCYDSILPVYIKTYFSFYIYIFLWEHLICIMSTAVFVFGIAYAVMQLF